MTEPKLFEAYSNVGVQPAVEWCACGLAIVAESRSDRDVVRAVRAHRLRRKHVAWAAAIFGPAAQQ